MSKVKLEAAKSSETSWDSLIECVQVKSFSKETVLGELVASVQLCLQKVCRYQCQFNAVSDNKPGREAVFLNDRAAIIRMRLAAVKSKQCASKKNKYYCPEVFLDAVADKLTTTADLFFDAELLSKFYYSVSAWSLSRRSQLVSNSRVVPTRA